MVGIMKLSLRQFAIWFFSSEQYLSSLSEVNIALGDKLLDMLAVY